MSIRIEDIIIGGPQAVDAALDATSIHPVQNKVVTAALEDKADLVDGKIPAEELPAMDFIPNDEKGAANGVAQLDANGKVVQEQLPKAGDGSANTGAVYGSTTYGIRFNSGRGQVDLATSTEIDNRNSQYKPIVPTNLNYAVTAALTDSNHITLTAEQQATAQSVFNVYGTLQGTGAPTTSTAGAVGQRYEDTSTQKLYTCTAVTIDDTDPQNPVTTYTWTDDVNAKGGDFSAPIRILNLGDNYMKIGYDGNQSLFALNAWNCVFDLKRTYTFISNQTVDIRGTGYINVTAPYLKLAGGYSSAVTVIPAATTAYTLAEGTYSHTPDAASTYTLPDVTDSTRTHTIVLTLDFTNVQTYAFQDASGTAITPLFTPTVSVGDVYTFKCEYSSLQNRWLIWPCKEGAVSDDYVMQSEVGAVNGVAGLDANGKVVDTQLPQATYTTWGAVRVNQGFGVGQQPSYGNYALYVVTSTTSDIDGRVQYMRPIAPNNLNYAVTAALTDSNHITLSTAQQSTAQQVLGVNAALSGSGAPTTSTAGKLLDRYLDTATGKTYTCTNMAVDETDPENPVYTYTWTDDINAKGGMFTQGITVGDNPAWNIKLTTQNLNIGLLNGSQNAIGAFYLGQLCNSAEQFSLVVGYSLLTGYGNIVPFSQWFGRFNIGGDMRMCVGNGLDANSRHNALELDTTGNLQVSGGYQQGITEIPAATSAYALGEGSFSHLPSSAPTYTLPDVTKRIVADSRYYMRNTATDGTGYYGWLSGSTNRYTASATPSVGDNTYTNTALTSGASAITSIDSRTHRIDLTIDFTTVQTYSFQDASGNAIVPLFTPTVSAGDVYTFKCEYSSVKQQWLIWPCKEGAVSDDYVMQSEVGAANGVAGLNNDGIVPREQLPFASNAVQTGSWYTPGIVRMGSSAEVCGISIASTNGAMSLTAASSTRIDSRATGFRCAIVPDNLNYAVTAALTDANHITLDSTQQATAQSVIGAYGTLQGSAAPTTSTAGAVGQRYLDTSTQKLYTCTAKTNTGTEEEPVYSYTWTDDINAKGGTLEGSVNLGNYGKIWTTGAMLLGANSQYASAYPCFTVGYGCYAYSQYTVTFGESVRGGVYSVNYAVSQKGALNGGRYNIGCNPLMSMGNGTGEADRRNAFEISTDGDVYASGGYQQGITTIPSATTAYTLHEGVSSHVPSAAPTYTLPDIGWKIVAEGWRWVRYAAGDGTGYYAWATKENGDGYKRYTASATPTIGDYVYTDTALTTGAQAITALDNRTHECILNVRFSSAVLTYAFEDSAGNSITPLSTPSLEDGTVVSFLCQYEPLLGQWTIMPVVKGKYTAQA